jgi:hypothetical protein
VSANVIGCDADAGAPLDAGEPIGCGQALALAAPGSTSCTPPAEGTLNPIEDFALRAGEPATFRVTGNGAFFGEGWHYEVWGSPDGCALDEQLAAFQLDNGPIDLSVCLAPARSHPHVVLFYRFAPTDGVSLSTWELKACGGCAGL